MDAGMSRGAGALDPTEASFGARHRAASRMKSGSETMSRSQSGQRDAVGVPSTSPVRPAWLLAVALSVSATGAPLPARAEPERGDQHAARGALVVALGPGERIDWTRGLLVATGAAAGDLRAPSPELARVKAERQARDAARARLRRLARELPLADGRALGAALQGEAEKRFDRALAAVLDEQVEHGSDGSVVLAAALPLEAARAAAFGASPPPVPGGERGPTALVIEGGRHIKRPVLGLKLVAGKERYAGPTVFAVRGDALGPERLGARPVKLRAASFRGGALHLEGDDAAARLAEARAAGSLVIVEIAAPGKGRGDKRASRERSRRDRGAKERRR